MFRNTLSLGKVAKIPLFFLGKAAEIICFYLGKKEMLSSNTSFTLKSCRYRQKTLYLHIISAQNLPIDQEYEIHFSRNICREVRRFGKNGSQLLCKRKDRRCIHDGQDLEYTRRCCIAFTQAGCHEGDASACHASGAEADEAERWYLPSYAD